MQEPGETGRWPMSLWSVVRCDTCGAIGPAKPDDVEASEAAEEHGWQQVEAIPVAPLTLVKKNDECANCRYAGWGGPSVCDPAVCGVDHSHHVETATTCTSCTLPVPDGCCNIPGEPR